MKQKRLIVSVSNDYATDKRVQRTCKVFMDLGYQPLVICRQLKNSPELPDLPYKVKRMNLLFTKGALFYAELNLRLLLQLLFRKGDLLLANDLDTLLPNFLISRIKRKKIVFDSHEYFTGVPELKERHRIRKIWKCIESFIVPRLGKMITVNSSIATLFHDEYKVNVAVVRNVPELKTIKNPKSREELGLSKDKKVLLIQGSGINVERGAEEAVQAMQFLEGYVLLIIGGGDVFPVLKEIVQNKELQGKVIFKDRMSPEKLRHFTAASDLGLSLDKANSINYKYSLPNKLMDYIHAGIPVLASRLPEIEKIITTYSIGDFIDVHEPEHIASKIEEMFKDQNRIIGYKLNCSKAAEQLNWDNESNVLRDFIVLLNEE